MRSGSRTVYTVGWVRCSTGEHLSCSGLTPMLVFRRIRELLRHEDNVTIISIKRDIGVPK